MTTPATSKRERPRELGRRQRIVIYEVGRCGRAGANHLGDLIGSYATHTIKSLEQRGLLFLDRGFYRLTVEGTKVFDELTGEAFRAGEPVAS